MSDALAPPVAAPRPLPERSPPIDVVAALEAVETRAWSELCEAPADAIRTAARLSLARREGFIAASAAAFDVLAFNRVIGLDPGIALDDRLVGRVAAHYRRRGVSRVFLPWPASSPPPAALPRLVDGEIVLHNRWVKLWRDASAPATVRSRLSFAPLAPRHAGAMTAVLASAFDFPAPLAATFAAVIGRPGWRHFGLFDRRRLVAVAGMHLAGETAWLGPAATLASHRGRGAQQELLGRRIEAAAAAGCRLLTVETAEPTPDRPVASYRNIRRLGFVELYRRPNYRLELAPTAGQGTSLS